MLHYQHSGAGKTILFVHGNSQSLQVWDGVVNQPVLVGYHTVCVDLPGHGKSPWSKTPEKDYTLQGFASELTGFIQSYIEGEYVVVGTSLGSTIFAEALPGLTNCKGLFFIGACIATANLTPNDAFYPEQYSEVSYEAAPGEDRLENYLNLVVFDQNNLIARDQYKAVFKATDPAVRSMIAYGLQTSGWSDHITAINKAGIPVALVYGENERIIRPHYLAPFVIPSKWQNRIITVPQAGHSVQIDQPAALAVFIADFVRTCLP